MHSVFVALLVGAAAAAPRCYVDRVDARQLPHVVCEAGTGDCAALTVRYCAAQCRALDYEVAGVEAGHACSCGHALANASAAAPLAECDDPCAGNATETCGGEFRLMAFDPSGYAPPPPPAADPVLDPRWIPNGLTLRDGGYSCQPYCAVLPSGTWSCVMTYIAAPRWAEGSPGEHMVGMRSTDQGKTWTDFVALEPYSNATTAQVSAYGSVVARPDGSRVFAVWIQNVHNVSHLPGAAPSTSFRADMLGAFVWKYSDDEGATWSEDHYEIPVPYGYIESVNSFSKSKNGTGDVQIMWQVDHVKVLDDGTALFAFTKIGTYAVAAPEEIFVLASRNLLSEDDPTKVTWEMWPDDDHGIGAVGAYDSPSRVTEEPHVLPFDGDAKLALFWRTDQGYMGHARTTTSKFSSLDAWTNSSYAVYEDTWASGSEAWVKQPRGPLSPKKQPNGLWLMTYYNTEPLGAFAAAATVSDRNNMWLTVGREAGGTIKWSQPELALYDRVHSKFHGYPDVVTDGGKVYITEAYKGAPGSEVKTHEVAPALLEGLYGQNAAKTVATAGVVWESSAPAPLPAGALPNFMNYTSDRYGFTIDAWVSSLAAVAGAAVLVDATDAAGAGARLTGFANGTVSLLLNDTAGVWGVHWTDPTCATRLKAPGDHHVAAIADGGPKMILFAVDGKLCDGGPNDGWPKGWAFFPPALGDVGAAATVAAGDVVKSARLYNRVLYVSELVGNWRAGL